MDLCEILDVTEPVPVTFMDHEFTVHVYTAGHNRLTLEEREAIRPTESEATESADMSSGIRYARRVLSVISKGIDMDGEPLVVRGIVYPENVGKIPDQLLMAISEAALEKWNARNPTTGLEQPNGSQLGEMLEQSQAESTMP